MVSAKFQSTEQADVENDDDEQCDWAYPLPGETPYRERDLTVHIFDVIAEFAEAVKPTDSDHLIQRKKADSKCNEFI